MESDTWQATIGQSLDGIESAYAVILNDVQSISATQDYAELTDEIAGRISRQVEAVGSLGEEAAMLYQQLPAEQRRSPENLARKSRIEEKVRSLLNHIGQLEKSTRQHMDQLAPQIHKGVLGLKMRQAYGNQSG